MNRRNFLSFLFSAPVAAVMVGRGIAPAPPVSGTFGFPAGGSFAVGPSFGEIALRSTTGPVDDLAISPLTVKINNHVGNALRIYQTRENEKLILNIFKRGIARGDLDHPNDPRRR